MEFVISVFTFITKHIIFHHDRITWNTNLGRQFLIPIYSSVPYQGQEMSHNFHENTHYILGRSLKLTTAQSLTKFTWFPSLIVLLKKHQSALTKRHYSVKPIIIINKRMGKSAIPKTRMAQNQKKVCLQWTRSRHNVDILLWSAFKRKRVGFNWINLIFIPSQVASKYIITQSCIY